MEEQRSEEVGGLRNGKLKRAPVAAAAVNEDEMIRAPRRGGRSRHVTTASEARPSPRRPEGMHL